MKVISLLLVSLLISCGNLSTMYSVEERESIGLSGEWITHLHPLSISQMISNDGNEWCNAITIDREDNIYASCANWGSLFLDNPGGKRWDFIVKIDKNGTFQWAQTLGGQLPLVYSSFDAGLSLGNIVIDDELNVYFVGQTEGDITELNNDPTESTSDLVWGKLSPEGDLVFIQQLGQSSLSNFATSVSFATPDGSENESGSIRLASNGDLIILGNTYGQLTDLNSTSTADVFVLKASGDTGNIIDMVQLGDQWILDYISGGGYASATSNGNDQYPNFIIDDNNFLYSSFRTNNDLSEANANYDIAYMKMDLNFNLIFLKQYGASSAAAYSAIPGNYPSSSSSHEFPSTIGFKPDGSLQIGVRTKSNLGDDSWSSNNDIAFLDVNKDSGEVLNILHLGQNSGAGSTGWDLISSGTFFQEDGSFIFVGGIEIRDNDTFAGLPLFDDQWYSPMIIKIDSDGNFDKAEYFAGSKDYRVIDSDRSWVTGLNRTSDGHFIVAFETVHEESGLVPSGTDIIFYKRKEESLFLSPREDLQNGADLNEINPNLFSDLSFYIRNGLSIAFDETEQIGVTLNGGIDFDRLFNNNLFMINSYLSFDGIDDFISLDDHADTRVSNTDSFTVAGWINMQGSSSGVCTSSTLFTYDDRDDDDGDETVSRSLMKAVVKSDNTLEFEVGDTVTGLAVLNTTESILSGSWYHVAFVRNVALDTLQIYINGDLSAEVPDTTTGTWETTGQYFQIGRFKQGTCLSYFTGSMDEIFMTKEALLEEDLSNIYNNQKLIFNL